jgi:hypothetical protein
MNTVPELMTLVTFAASWAVLSVGHALADHVGGQTDFQAAHKSAPSAGELAAGASPRRGWAANLAHVAQYHAVLMLLGLGAWLVLPLHWSAPGVVVALVWSAGTHAFLDRRWPVRWLLTRLRQARFAELADGGLNGMYLADQALHGLALGVAAVALAVIA